MQYSYVSVQRQFWLQMQVPEYKTQVVNHLFLIHML